VLQKRKTSCERFRNGREMKMRLCSATAFFLTVPPHAVTLANPAASRKEKMIRARFRNKLCFKKP
jgi:hypothetical protein